jgi:hypothetical protein
MREIAIGLLMVSGLGAGVFMWPAADVAGKVYPLSPAEAVQRLMAAPTNTGTPPFFGRDVVPASAGTDYVEFMADDGVVVCKADIVPEGNGVLVEHSCGDPAFAGNVDELQQSAFAEFVDAAIERRPFNASAGNAQMVGSVFQGLPDMEEMEAQVRENQREMKQAAEYMEFYGGYDEDQTPPTPESYYE